MSFPAPIVADRFLQYAKCPARFRQKLVYTGYVKCFDTFLNFYQHPTLGHYRSTDLLMTETPVFRFNKEQGLLGHDINGLLRVNRICQKFDEEYLNKKKVDPMTCRSVIDTRHYFYQVANEFSIRLNFNPKVPLDEFETKNDTPNNVVAAIGALTSEDLAYPGPGFANETEYEFYVALQTRGRTAEAITYAAGIPGAYVHNARDPFIYGHCYLLLFKREEWINIYQRGASYLTKDFFEHNKMHLDRDKVVLYMYRPGTGDAHLTLHSSIPAMATGVYTTVGQIADKLEVAFGDGVVDDETLQWIYASVLPSRKRPGIA